MRSGDRPGLQNRRAAGHPVTGGFDPHSLPPFFKSAQRDNNVKSGSVDSPQNYGGRIRKANPATKLASVVV
jgi:hypothetical protein